MNVNAVGTVCPLKDELVMMSWKEREELHSLSWFFELQKAQEFSSQMKTQYGFHSKCM